MTEWPPSPAYPSAPESGRPSRMIPSPSPTAPEMYTKLRTERAEPRRNSARAPASASLATRTSSIPKRSAIMEPNGTPDQPRFGDVLIRPSLRRTRPAAATPTPTSRDCFGSRSRRGLASSSIRSITASGDTDFDGFGSTIASRMCPPSPMVATAVWSTSRTAASTTAPVRRARAIEEGRPGLPVVVPESSTSSPRLTSSATRSRMVERLRPVASASADRDTASSRWTRSSTALRLWRRNSSDATPRRLTTCCAIPRVLGVCVRSWDKGAYDLIDESFVRASEI